MLKVQKITTENLQQSTVAPEIFIDSVELEADIISVYFHISDNVPNRNLSTRWLNNEYILNNLYLNIDCNGLLFKETLKSLVKKNKIVNYTINDCIKFKNNSTGNIILRAFCGNIDNSVKGIETKEIILKTGTPEPSFYGEKKYTYISKFKDLNNLTLPNIVLSQKVEKDSKNDSKDLYISYSSERKKANLLFTFNLENFLDKNSKPYRILKKYDIFKDIILYNSYILNDTVSFYKRDLNDTDSLYKKIKGNPKILKTNSDLKEQTYLITCSDEDQTDAEKKSYLIKTSFQVHDYSTYFLKEEILNKLREVKKFIVSYKEDFELCLNNSSIQNPSIYFFENKYEKSLQKIKTAIEHLSYLYSFYTKKNLNMFKSFFLNIFHPLTTRVELLEKLLSSVTSLERIFLGIVKEVYSLGMEQNSLLLEKNIMFEYEFKKNSNNSIINFIDYNYDSKYGFEVIMTKSRQSRINNRSDGLEILSQENLETRQKLEAIKYFNNDVSSITRNIKHLSISYIEMQNSSFNLLSSVEFGNLTVRDGEKEVFLDDLFTQINNLNNQKFKNFDARETTFLLLADRNIFFKSLSKKLNNSYNPLNNGVLFDNNSSTKEDSTKFIDNTGIQNLFFLVDGNKFYKIPNNLNIMQKMAADPPKNMPYKTKFAINKFYRDEQYYNNFTGATYGNISAVDTTSINFDNEQAATKFQLGDEVFSDISQKPKAILWYNNFFEFREIIVGDSYSLYELDESFVNPFFTKKLKFFNKFFILNKNNKTKINEPKLQFNDEKFIEELKFNFMPYLLNRVTEKEIMKISVSEI